MPRLDRDSPPPRKHEFGLYLNDEEHRMACELIERGYPLHSVLRNYIHELYYKAIRDDERN